MLPWLSEALTEALPGLLVLLYGLMQLRYWLAVHPLRRELAECRARLCASERGEKGCRA